MPSSGARAAGKTPVGPFNRAQWNHNFYAGWDFSGQSTYRRYNTNANAQLKTFQNLNVYLNLEQQDITKTALRGRAAATAGAGLLHPAATRAPDSRKDVVFGAFVGFGGAYERGPEPRLQRRRRHPDPAAGRAPDLPRRRASTRPGARTSTSAPSARAPRRATLHGTIEQQTFSLTLRATYNLTPRLHAPVLRAALRGAGGCTRSSKK